VGCPDVNLVDKLLESNELIINSQAGNDARRNQPQTVAQATHRREPEALDFLDVIPRDHD
jgi:hypothetical protein